MYTLSKEEQETTINWCAADTIVNIDTADPVLIRKLDQRVKQFPDEYHCTSVDPLYNAKQYTAPLRYIRFGKPASKAQKEAARKNGHSTVFSTADSPLVGSS